MDQIQKQHSEMPLPTIAMDIEVGKLVDHIDIDHQALAQHMLDSGATPDQISETSIIFKPTPFDKRVPETLGLYQPRKKRITVGVGKPTELPNWVPSYNSEDGSMSYVPLDPNDRNFDEVVTSVLSTDASMTVSDTLAHEVQHRLDDVTGESKESDEHRNRLLRKTVKKILSLAGVVVGTNIATRVAIENDALMSAINISVPLSASYVAHKSMKKDRDASYITDPGEHRAQKAEYMVPDFVTIKAKK